MANKEQLAVLNQGADAWNAWRREHPEIIPNLRRADLGGPDIGGEFLDVLGVDIQHLPSWLDLRGADLRNAQIEAAKLHQPDLTPRKIKDIVDRIRDLRSRPFPIHNLFISYSHLDKVFVEHMEKHLDVRGIRFWRDIHDAPAGRLDKIVPRAIRQNPTMLLVLWEHSARSDWVGYEAQTALDLQKELRRDILCPVALDKSWETCNWSAPLRNHIKKYNVLDFSNWQNATVFEGKFRLLLSGIVVNYDDEGQHESQQRADKLGQLGGPSKPVC